MPNLLRQIFGEFMMQLIFLNKVLKVKNFSGLFEAMKINLGHFHYYNPNISTAYNHVLTV